MTVPSLLGECKNWTVQKKYERIKEIAKMNFLWSAAGYVLYDYRPN
jgi:hypothetical protein